MYVEASKQQPTAYHINRGAHYFFYKNEEGILSLSSSFQSKHYKIVSDQGIGLLDTLGNVLVEPIYDDIDYYTVIKFDNSEQLAPMYYLAKEGKMKVVDQTGKVIVPAKYDRIQPLYHKLYLTTLDSLVGLLDSAGKEIITPKYKAINAMRKDGFYAVSNGRWGLVEAATGKEVTPLVYDDVGRFQKGFAVVSRKHKYEFINRQLQEICALKYDRVNQFDKEGVAVVTQGQYKGVINRAGKEILPCKYSDIETYRPQKIKVCAKGLYGVFDKTGKVILPAVYSRLDPYQEGYLVCKTTSTINEKSGRYTTSTKCGLLDQNAQVTLPLRYKMVGIFKDGWCPVCQSANKTKMVKCGFINRQNELVIPCVFQEKMYGLYWWLNTDAEEWITTKKFAKHLEAYQARNK